MVLRVSLLVRVKGRGFQLAFVQYIHVHTYTITTLYTEWSIKITVFEKATTFVYFLVTIIVFATFVTCIRRGFESTSVLVVNGFWSCYNRNSKLFTVRNSEFWFLKLVTSTA